MEKLQKMISEKSVVIFSKNSCCMSHTIKTLFLDFGVNPTIYELDDINKGKEIEQELTQLGCSPTVPVVFIGGQLVGGANQVMSLHLNRSLFRCLSELGRYGFDKYRQIPKIYLIIKSASVGLSVINLRLGGV
ncbi:hypothetical protein F2Q70_00039485 [Brassica cretica]|uniref:Glutaredoxin domain-containing protein n=1 Tax=Brassica cretica TaxID=69181 RepID=A0A8S9MPN1_BRACR|nr:hypothetical protein F2Q70_00039485 [Brassica cretica]KAF2619219.1 hypothetical protein F2Q68_00040187 [Brassica cretica]